MAQFVEYQLNGTANTTVWPLPSATLTSSGTPPAYSINYTTTSLYGLSLPDDLNGAISVQIVSMTNTPTVVLEVCNRDPTTMIASPPGTLQQGLSPASLDVGLTALFTDIVTAGLWVQVMVTNVNTNVAAVNMTAAGLYVAQALGYRNIRVRQTASAANSQSQVILGYGLLI